MHVLSRLAVSAIFSVAALNTSGAALYDESLTGDLSDSGLGPTPLTVVAGENQILGELSNTANGTDPDYFTFTVPSGLELTAIVVLPGTTTGPEGTFFAVQAGNQVTVPPDAPDFTGLLGFTSYLAGNGNIITDVGLPGNGATGFIPPLGPGTYAFLVQDTAEGTFNYGLNFQLLAAAPDSGVGVIGCAMVFAAVAGLNSFKRVRSGT
jgi:hypothetical protein